MYLQESASDEFQMTKLCPCEIIENQLHEGVHLVIFQSHDANLKILPVKLIDSHRNLSTSTHTHTKVCVCFHFLWSFKKVSSIISQKL